MNFRKLTLILLLITFSTVNAQKLELGKVSIEELQQKAHPKDSSAVAAILFKTGEVRFEDLTTITKVKTKIKIYKKEGYNWANEEILHYLQGENVSISDAITYNLVNGKIEKTKLKSDGEFEQKINRYFSQKKIAMPNVKVGSIIEFEYTIRSGNFGSLRDWYFQSSIPVDYSVYNVRVPGFLTFNRRTKGFIYPKLTSEPTYSQETSSVFTLRNVPAMKEESFVNNINNYRASVSHELALVNLPGRIYKTFSTDWESVTKTIYEDDDFGSELRKTGYFEDDLKTILLGKTTKEERIKAVYDFVKTKVKWNDYNGYSCNDGVKKAYKDGSGNVAEINLLLTAMLRYAEINANPVLISTRSNGIALFPSRTGFNYVIAGIESPEGLILLDATEKYGVPNVLPLRDLNWFGRLIRKDGTSLQVELSPKQISNESAILSIVMSDKGIIDGKIRRQFTNHNALDFRNKNIDIKRDTYLENLENKNNAIEIGEYLRENETDLSKPIIETFDFKDTKDVEIINDKIYFSPLLFLATKENLFKQEVREYPVDFGYPFNEKYNISIQIPDGYKVESLPASINTISEDKTLSFKYLIITEGNKIQVVVTSLVNTAIIPADFYEEIKSFYKQVVDKQNERIILKKI